MLIYLVSLPIWNFVLPVYAFWKFDDFSWGDTRKTDGEQKKVRKAGIEYEGEFDSSKITMKKWSEFERERRERAEWVGGEIGGVESMEYGAGVGDVGGGVYNDYREDTVYRDDEGWARA